MAATLKLGNKIWATKEGSLLGYNNENGNYKPLPFDFTRASSATFVNKDGLIEIVGGGVPRIDFLNDSNGALLLEPTRSNLITYSEDYSQSEWTNASYTKDASITYNSASVAPDGTLGVYQYECTVSGTNSQLGALKAISSGVAYSNSVYLRRITGSGIVNLRGVNNGEIDVTSELTSSWKRFEITQTSNSTNGRFYINALVSGDVIEVWGAQLEQGSYATSYIPTQGATAGVTRVGESCIGAGNEQVINSTEGVLYAEISQDNNSFNTISISDGGTSDRITIAYQNNTIKLILVYNNNVVQLEESGYLQNSFHKVAIKYTSSNVSLIINGFELLTASRGAFADTLNTLQFAQGNGGNNFYGKIKDVRVYNTALTDQELIALTS